MEVADLTFVTKDYVDGTLGARVRGHWDRYECMTYIEGGQPLSTVLIRDTLRFEHQEVFVAPHPDCHASHDHRPEKWTVMTCRAFPNVDKEHRSAVQSLGRTMRTVRVPVLKENNDYIHGMAGVR